MDGDDPPPGAPRAAAAEVRLDRFLSPDGPSLVLRRSPDAGGLFEATALPAGTVTLVLFDEEGKEIGRATAAPGDPRDPPLKIPRNR